MRYPIGNSQYNTGRKARKVVKLLRWVMTKIQIKVERRRGQIHKFKGEWKTNTKMPFKKLIPGTSREDGSV